MKLPSRISEITITKNRIPVGPHPPKGFVPFAEHEYGDLDCFGLYWPIGRESQPPIVVEFWHSYRFLNPVFSSLDAFLEITKHLEEHEEYISQPSLEEDPMSPMGLYLAAGEDIKQNAIEAAVGKLEQAVAVLPDYNDGWNLLARLYRKIGQKDKALKAILRAILSPMFFAKHNPVPLGKEHLGLLQWFQRQDTDDPELLRDPLWQRRKDLSFLYRGMKENKDYPLFQECVAEYEKTGRNEYAVLLFLKSAELIMTEPRDYQQSLGFSEALFLREQDKMFKRLLGDSRELRL